MSIRNWRAAALVSLLGLAAIWPAHAGVVDFEDVAPTLFSGSAVPSGGFNFASSGAGFSGVDSAVSFVFGNAPPNSDGQFLFALNGDGITMTSGAGGSFFVDFFDAAFIAPLPGLGAGIVAGQLHVDALDANGSPLSEVFDFPASDANGNFNFGRFLPVTLGGVALTSATFTACVYEANGSCSFNDPLAQFALDNVPEPGSMALVVAGLGVFGALRRRRAA